MSTLLERMNESLEAVTLLEKKESEKKDYDHMKKVMAEYKKKVNKNDYDDMDGEVDKMTEEKYKEMKEKCASYDKDQKTNESLNDRIKNVVSLNESKGDDGEKDPKFKSIKGQIFDNIPRKTKQSVKYDALKFYKLKDVKSKIKQDGDFFTIDIKGVETEGYQKESNGYKFVAIFYYGDLMGYIRVNPKPTRGLDKEIAKIVAEMNQLKYSKGGDSKETDIKGYGLKANDVMVKEALGDDGDGKIENEAEFRSATKKILKKAHGEDYDEDEANEMIASLIKKYGKDGDWSDAIGVVQNSLGD